MAFYGPQSDEWLNAKGNRPFGAIPDIREELVIGAISTSTIQTINRGRCRRVIDTQGNCAPTDIFLLLPNDTIGKSVLSNVQTAMPGIQTVSWEYSGATRKVKRSKYDASLLRQLENEYTGEIPARSVMQTLGIPQRSFERLIHKAKDETSQLYAELAEINVIYQAARAGRGAKAYFIKT